MSLLDDSSAESRSSILATCTDVLTAVPINTLYLYLPHVPGHNGTQILLERRDRVAVPER